MKNYIALALSACCMFSASVTQAQRIPRIPLKRITKVKVNNILKSRIPAAATHTAALPPVISRMAQIPPERLTMTPVRQDAPIRASVLPIKETSSPFSGLISPFTATSFVIEEEFEGKKYLWGVTAAHIAQLMGMFSDVWMDGIVPQPVKFAALGNAEMADVALFPLPEDWPLPVPPLKLAGKMPAPGEKTYSFGFFDEDFYLVPNREIKEVTPNRLITSLEFDTPNRGGACGGPVLNKKGEVVGVHIGSSDTERISFVVPAADIKRLLRAYRNNGQNLQPLVFNGLDIGRLNINESIARIRTVTDGYITGDFVAHHQEKDIDYAHLETLTLDMEPDELQIFVSHKAFAFGGPDQKDFFFQLTYNFATGQTTRKRIPALPH